ncbi:MAG TPA: rRNA maturation RNase YbeY [Chitinophagaceae bacterium]|nr:rRNA maturation RNase YbeY [Chitinophagaceae bacterium]
MKASPATINFYFQQQCRLTNRRQLKDFIIAVFKRYRTRFSALSIIFCSDDYLLDINRQYLDHDSYTDIITFNLAEPGEPVNGEIYISVDRVRENARVAGVSFAQELHRVMFHGVLHLCGLNDSTTTQKRSMTRAENRLLTQYFG